MNRFFIFFFGLFVLFLSQAVAQKGVFDVRLTLNKVDCGGQKLFIDVAIKSHDNASEFLMGNANFRFLYDARFIQHPLLSAQYNFSSVGKTPDLSYAPQSLNGSSERADKGIVSLNIIHANTDQQAARVGSQEWIPIATVQFDIVNPQVSVGTTLTWNDNTTFPVTGLSEIVPKSNAVEVDSYVVRASGIFQNLTIGPMADICHALGASERGELMIPEGFSPNGDGINDRFVIHHLGSLKANLTIFTVSGRIVYTNSDYQNDWDGRTEQGPLADGTYFYDIRLSDGRTFQRSMTISH